MTKSILAHAKANLAESAQDAARHGFDTDIGAAQFGVSIAAIQAQIALAEAADAQVAATLAQTAMMRTHVLIAASHRWGDSDKTWPAAIREGVGI